MSIFRDFLRKIVPRLYQTLAKNYRSLRKRNRLRRKILVEYTDKFGWSIQRGPFKGLKLTPYRQERLPILIGSYEDEIHVWLEDIIRKRYDTIINIGAGTGYYAVGFAVRMPSVHVIAYENDQQNRELCKKNAQLNNVWERITLLGNCDSVELNSLLALNDGSKRTLIFSDCEGCEFELLDPNEIHNLRSIDLLIEIHLHKVDDPELFVKKLNASHKIKVINAIYKDPINYPELSMWSRSNQRLALIERRPPEGSWQWIYCITPRNDSPGN